MCSQFKIYVATARCVFDEQPIRKRSAFPSLTMRQKRVLPIKRNPFVFCAVVRRVLFHVCRHSAQTKVNRTNIDKHAAELPSIYSRFTHRIRIINGEIWLKRGQIELRSSRGGVCSQHTHSHRK